MDYWWYECVISIWGVRFFIVCELVEMSWYFCCGIGLWWVGFYYEIFVIGLGWVNCDWYSFYEGEKLVFYVEGDKVS